MSLKCRQNWKGILIIVSTFKPISMVLLVFMLCFVEVKRGKGKLREDYDFLLR